MTCCCLDIDLQVADIMEAWHWACCLYNMVDRASKPSAIPLADPQTSPHEKHLLLHSDGPYWGLILTVLKKKNKTILLIFLKFCMCLSMHSAVL